MGNSCEGNGKESEIGPVTNILWSKSKAVPVVQISVLPVFLKASSSSFREIPKSAAAVSGV